MKIYTDKQVKEMTEMLADIKSYMTKLIAKYTALYADYIQLKAENARLRAILNIPDVDFPNSEKGGNGEPETPSFFPDDSNLF